MQIPQTARWKTARGEAEGLTSGYTRPPIPALEIAERCGVDVVFADFGEQGGSVAGFCDFGASKLYVNADDMIERQFFTIAHELGHWILHRDFYRAYPEKYPVLPRYQSVDKNDVFEQEANHFAANLLVPRRLLKPVAGSPIAALSKAFGVSKTMMEFRLRNIA